MKPSESETFGEVFTTNESQYVPLTIIETWVPGTFVALYDILMIAGLYLTSMGLVGTTSDIVW